MQVYQVMCGGHEHRIGLDEDGYLHIFDHDLEEEEALFEMGIEPFECYRLLRSLQDEPLDEVLVDAILDEDLTLVNLSLEIGADPGGEVFLGEPLSKAVETSNLAIVKRLFEAGLVYDVGDRRHSGVLFTAAMEGDAEIVRFLLENGALIDEIDAEDYLRIADTGYGDVIGVFLDAGVDPAFLGEA